MWKKGKFSEKKQDEICEYINEFIEEANRLREIKEEEIKENFEYYNNDLKEYIKIHDLIESRIDDIESIISNRGMFDYCGKNIKQVIEVIGIESELINEDTNFKEMDSVLSFIDIKLKHIKKKNIRKNNWCFIIIMTLLDNYLVNNLRLLINEHSLLSKEKQKEILIQFGKDSLKEKVKWFAKINPKLEYSDERLTIYNAKRNTLIHSSGIISERIIGHIPIHLQQKYGFEKGLVVEIEDDELIEIFDDINKLAINIFQSISYKFCMSFVEKGIGTSFEELEYHIKDEL